MVLLSKPEVIESVRYIFCSAVAKVIAVGVLSLCELCFQKKKRAF